jgi:tetratricopeptide (TPR) repeat protein
MNGQTLIIALLSLCLTLPATGLARDESPDDVDYLALAALMMRDGNLDRALVALDQVDTTDEELDLVRYYTLRGMTHLRRGENELARDAFLQAIDSGEVEAVVHVYLAQVYYQLEDYRSVIRSLDSAGDAVARVPSVYHMRAQCHWLLDEPALALGTLDAASGMFTEDQSFLRRKVFFLIDLGLFKEASELGRLYLETSQGKLEDYIALGNALRASGDLDEAAQFLESAQLQFPGSVEVKKVLAHVYIDRGETGAAADLLYQAALRDSSLMAEAAELYRRSGQVYRALAINSALADQPEKFRQRLALYLEMESFEQAAAMETALYRVGLLAEEDLRYAMAYAFFKTGEFERAEGHLSQLTRPDLFRKAAELRRVIQDCGEESWKCL